MVTAANSRGPFYFAWPYDFSHTLFKYDEREEELTRVDDQTQDFGGAYLVQYNQTLFALKDDSKEWCQYTNLRTESVLKEEKEDFPAPRYAPCLINYQNEAIFVCTGYQNTTCYKYLPDVDRWSEAPQVNTPRQNASGCCLGDKIYVFCGFREPDYEDTIEVMDARNLLAGGRAAWTLLDVIAGQIPKCSLPLVQPVGPFEILILGGNGAEATRNISVLDTRTSQVLSRQMVGFKVRKAERNQGVTTGQGQICGLFEGPNYRLFFGSYQVGDDKPTIIEEIFKTY